MIKETLSSRYTLAIASFLAGTIISASVAYYFSWQQHTNERREEVFEEVAFLIENGHHILNRIDESFLAKEPPESRTELWNKFDEIQLNYQGNKTRLLFLLNKYYGKKVASKIKFVLSDLDNDPDLRKTCEEQKGYPYNYITYHETWTGSLSEDPTGEWDGYKWKMMNACGMDVTPFIEELWKQKAERDADYNKRMKAAEQKSKSDL